MRGVIAPPVAARSDLSHSETSDNRARIFRRLIGRGACSAIHDRIGRTCLDAANEAIVVAGDLRCGGDMKRIVVAIAGAVLVVASAANAQSVSGRVSGTVGEVGSVAGQAAVGAGPNGSAAPSSTNPPNSALLGGELPGGVKMKLGDKVIDLRGNVGVGDNGGNFKAGVGLPF